ncbi:hypothetical protein [Roseibium sp.]|uniref:hypothetical protein n=1 Tax=Roseibium sp. TaxID=1936156 RepID=UPI003B51CA3F
MSKTAIKTLLAGFFLFGTAEAQTIEKWNRGEVDGFTRYWTTNNVGASFVVWCHPERKTNGTLLHVVIDGATPQPNSRIKLVIDKDIIQLPVNGEGYTDTGCATCADSFEYVWHQLRSATAIAVKFSDNRYAGFSLKGAKELLPAKACPTDWHKKQAS